MLSTAKNLLLAASAGAAVLTAHVTDAWSGTMTLYQDAQFKGPNYTTSFSASQQCINVGCFNDRASSATWTNVVQSGIYGPTYIAFYTDSNCRGNHKSWRVVDNNFPRNFQKDGINDAISSFMVWETSGDASSYYTVCPFTTTATANVNTNETTEGFGVVDNAKAIPAEPASLGEPKPELSLAIGEK